MKIKQIIGLTTLTFTVSCSLTNFFTESNQPVIKKFIDTKKSTIIDITSNLEWQKCLRGTKQDDKCEDEDDSIDDKYLNSLKDAHDYCKSLKLAGKKWRVPTYLELSTMIELDEFHQKIDKNLYYTDNKLLFDPKYFQYQINSYYMTSDFIEKNGEKYIKSIYSGYGGYEMTNYIPEKFITDFTIRCVSKVKKNKTK